MNIGIITAAMWDSRVGKDKGEVVVRRCGRSSELQRMEKMTDQPTILASLLRSKIRQK